MKKYVVELTSKERRQLEELVKKGKVAGYKIRHAQMLRFAQHDRKTGLPESDFTPKTGILRLRSGQALGIWYSLGFRASYIGF